MAALLKETQFGPLIMNTAFKILSVLSIPYASSNVGVYSYRDVSHTNRYLPPTIGAGVLPLPGK